VTGRGAAHRAEQQREQGEKRKKRRRKPPAAERFREERKDGWFRPHAGHPWLDPAACGDPGYVPARQGVAVDGKERKGAKAGGGKKAHFLAAVTHVPGIVIAQDRVAKAGKANEISHFKPLLAHARGHWQVEHAHWLRTRLPHPPMPLARLNGVHDFDEFLTDRQSRAA
jgi:hypothetical protein